MSPSGTASDASLAATGDEVTLTSKSGKPLGRYFPDVVEILRGLKEKQFLLDGELIIPVGDALSFEALQLRLHPARVACASSPPSIRPS